MIFLSILAKTFALALAPSNAVTAGSCWLLSMVADLVAMRRAAEKGAGPLLVRRFLVWNSCAAVIGLAAAAVVAYAAMRWKEGIPVLSHLLAGTLQLLGQSAGVHDGRVFVTNMAGPLEFSASIDHLDLRLPALFLALSSTWLLFTVRSLGNAAAKLGAIAGGLLLAVLLRGSLWVLLVLGLSDFTSYNSDELPFRPLVDDRVMPWLYLPFLLAGGMLFARFLAAPDIGERPPAKLPRPIKWLGAPVLLLLFGVCFWQPVGTPKSGKVVFASHHAQWSPASRPYDREWYGADSGYNYACLKRLFQVFHPVEEIDVPLQPSHLEDAGILVVFVPNRGFSNDERQAIESFVRSGGGLFLIGDHTNVFGSTSNLNQIAGQFGFRFRDDVLFDLDDDFHQMLEVPDCNRSRFWHGMAFFKLRGPCSIRPTSLDMRSVYQVKHSKGVRAIYSVNNFYPPPHDGPHMTTGSHCVAATWRYGRGRVAAWADSTVFSNFEIFYPGKYQYLINTLDWLNHRDALMSGLVRRIVPVIIVLGLALVLGRWRDPRVALGSLFAAVLACAAAHSICTWWEARRYTFPQPLNPARWVFFGAHSDDPAHHLKEFITEEPYEQRYEVFIQWVLRTGAFSGFHLLGDDHVEGLHEHLRNSEQQDTALALIVRTPADLGHLDDLAAGPARADEPLLLMFASSIPAGQATERMQGAGLVTGQEALGQIAAAWPQGEAVVEAGGRRVIVVAGAERFSDRSMGLSEKAVPTPAVRARFDQAFGLIDRLLDTARETPPSAGRSSQGEIPDSQKN